MKRTITMVLAVVMILTLLAGCGGGQTNTPKNANQPNSQQPGIEGTSDETLRVALNAEPSSLDSQSMTSALPVNSDVASCMFEQMIGYENGEYVPELAESWELLDDCTLRLHLRRGVKFHDGHEFNADDVLYTFEKAGESPMILSYLSNFDTEKFNAIDEYTVDIVTKHPYPALFPVLSLWFFNVSDEEAIDALGGVENHRRNPVGTGPYKFVEWVAGSHILVERNEDYWGEKPYYKYIRFEFIVDATARSLALESGDVDVVTGVSYAQAAQWENDPNYNLVESEQVNVYYTWYNFNRDIMTNKDFRQALSYAIDTKALTTVCGIQSYATPADSFVSVAMPSHVANPDFVYNPDKAKELVKASGYDGHELQLIFEENEMIATVAEFLQNAWAQIGVNVKVESLAASANSERQFAGDYDLYIQMLTHWEPLTALCQFWRTGLMLNRTGYSNAEFDALNDEINNTSDDAARAELLHQVQELLMEEMPSTPLFNVCSIAATRGDLTGYQFDQMLGNHYHNIRPAK